MLLKVYEAVGDGTESQIAPLRQTETYNFHHQFCNQSFNPAVVGNMLHCYTLLYRGVGKQHYHVLSSHSALAGQQSLSVYHFVIECIA